MNIHRLLPILFLLFITVKTFSQSKVQKLYETEKYEKCIKLCDKNIKENKEKFYSLLYKSMVLTDGFENEKIIEQYPNPVYEALKVVSTLEKYKYKKAVDKKLYHGNKRKIKIVVKNALTIADTLYLREEIKTAKKIYKKLHEIYPNEKTYIFKIAKASEFDIKTTLSHLSGYSKKDLYRELYEITYNSLKYLKKGGKVELENALEKMYYKETCDFEIVTMFLIFLKKNYATSKKVNSLTKKFQEKFWQIDLLIEVNKTREKGYTCGGKKFENKPPLIIDNCLLVTSQKYAELMNKENHFSHTGPDGKSPWKRADDEGCYADGENIAAGYPTVKHAVNGWLHSPGHCKNIMGSHKYMGIGESGKYWVQMFR